MQVSFKGLEYNDLSTYNILMSAARGSYSPEPTRANGYKTAPEGIRRPVADALEAIDGSAGSYDTITIRHTETIAGENHKDDKYILQIQSPNGEVITENYVTRGELDNKKPGSRVEEVFTQFAKDVQGYMKNFKHRKPETPQEVVEHFTHKYGIDYRALKRHKVQNSTEYLNAKIEANAKGDPKYFEPFVKLDDIGELIDPDDIY